MEPALKTQVKTPQPAVARRLFQEACSLSGGILTDSVSGQAVERARYRGEPVVAATLHLGSSAAIRICLPPKMARQFAIDILNTFGPLKPGPDPTCELAKEEGPK